MLTQSSGKTTLTPPRPRQKPGSACDECRRRKLRCDRQQPQCGVCSESGVVCNTPTLNPPRGPKKGHLRALQSRIDLLEHRLCEQQRARSPPGHGSSTTPTSASNETSTDKQSPAQPSTPDSDAETNLDDAHSQAPSSLSISATDSLDLPTDTVKRKVLQASSGAKISELMRADLDQLYFDRVHLFAPILHRRRYHSWAREPSKSISQTCLQFAMWALATSLSAQLQDVRHSLYVDCREMLEAMDLEDETRDSDDIEQAQAWILVTLYELLRMNHRRGWTSAGRACRLVQLMRLYEIDKSTNGMTRSNGTAQWDWVKTEEKRRTFWMAYSLDRFVCVRNSSPLTLQEQVISTRLPAPEMEFQSDRPVLTGFLSEVMGTIETVHLSSFLECIVLATICGRSISHMQQSTVERLYGQVSQDFWNRHQWLDTLITQRIQALSLQFLCPSDQVDPMLLFTNMFAHATFLFLTKIIETLSRETGEYQPTVLEYAKRSLSVAHEIVHLTRVISQLGCFKAHPFLPIPLFLGAEYFMTHGNRDERFDLQLHEISQALRDLKGVNHLAQEYLHLMELQGREYVSRVRDGGGE